MNDIAIKWEKNLLNLEAIDYQRMNDTEWDSHLQIESKLMSQVSSELNRLKNKTEISYWKVLTKCSLQSLRIKVNHSYTCWC